MGNCNSSDGESTDPVFALLATAGLQEFYGKITDLGVRSVAHLSILDDADIEGMNMKSIQRKLLKTVIAGVPIPRGDTEYGTFDAPVSGVHAELQLLKLMPLRARALEGGVPEEAVEDAMEAENPKAALVELVVGRLGMA